MKRGGDPKLDLELTFLKLARDYTEPDVEGLIQRLETLETALENGSLAAKPAPKQSAGQSVGRMEESPLAEEPGAKPSAPKDDASGSSETGDGGSEGADRRLSPGPLAKSQNPHPPASP